MHPGINKLIDHITQLPDIEKVRLVDTILRQLDKPDPEIDQIWKTEAEKRWKAYKEGELQAIPYDEVMNKYK